MSEDFLACPHPQETKVTLLLNYIPIHLWWLGGALLREYFTGEQMSNCHGCGERLVLILSHSKKGGRRSVPPSLCCSWVTSDAHHSPVLAEAFCPQTQPPGSVQGQGVVVYLKWSEYFFLNISHWFTTHPYELIQFQNHFPVYPICSLRWNLNEKKKIYKCFTL